MILRLSTTRLALTSLLLCSVAVMTHSLAQTPASTSASPAKKSAAPAESKAAANAAENSGEPRSPSEIDAQAQTDREAAAWGFVMTHHPQLGEVLSRLKIMHIGQYEKAINQITIAAERINKLLKADEKRGELGTRGLEARLADPTRRGQAEPGPRRCRNSARIGQDRPQAIRAPPAD